MRWQCELCDQEFSKSYALTQHISQKHPYLQGETNQSRHEKQLDTTIWELPLSENDSNQFFDEEQVDDSIWDLPDKYLWNMTHIG